MKRSLFAAAIIALAAGCSNGSTETIPPPERALITEEFTQITARSIGSSSDLIYVANADSSITVYPHDANGNVAPKYVIAGPLTGINDRVLSLSGDAQGNLYVALPQSIEVFAHGATGNVAPIRVLAGPATKIKDITAMTVDKTTGKIFIADNGTGGGYTQTLQRFPPNANGNMAPFASAKIPYIAISLTNDSTGSNLIRSHLPECCKSVTSGIDTDFKQFADNTSPTVKNYIVNFAGEIADDASTKTYLVAGGGKIYRLAEGTTGLYPNLSPKIISTIDDACADGIAVAPGPSPNTYITHGGSPTCTNAVVVYTNTAAGRASPLRTLTGSATLLNAPGPIYEGM